MESVRTKDRLIAGGVAACLFLLLVALSYNSEATSKIETDEIPLEPAETTTSSFSAETDLASKTDLTTDAITTEVSSFVAYTRAVHKSIISVEIEPALTPTSSVDSKPSKEKTKKKKKFFEKD